MSNKICLEKKTMEFEKLHGSLSYDRNFMSYDYIEDKIGRCVPPHYHAKAGAKPFFIPYSVKLQAKHPATIEMQTGAAFEERLSCGNH